MTAGLTRRGFVAWAGAGLTLGLAAPSTPGAEGTAGATFVQPFLRVAANGRVTVLAKHLDMGQGVWSALASIVAEELDADWRQVTVEGAPVDAAVYQHTQWGVQATGGSTSIQNSWLQLRVAGATARAMLLQAAAQRLGVPVARLQTREGVVSDGAGGRVTYGELADAAALLPVPRTVALKDPAQFRLLGHAVPRLDLPAKTRGEPVFGIDVQRPGMKVAVLQRPPRFGARLLAVDDAAARRVPGVVDVLRLPNAVAVVGEHTWAALEGRRALQVQWDESDAEMRSSAALSQEFRRLADSDEGLLVLQRGGAFEAMAGAARTVQAEYELPYLAHAAMEPLCVTGELRDGLCTMWGGFQSPSFDLRAVTRILGLTSAQVRLHTTYAGGSFGRRATFSADWVSELAQVLKTSAGAYPVKLMWTREDDLRGGFYRPMNLHRLSAKIAADGSLLALEQVIVAQSFAGQPAPGTMQKLDPFAVEGHFAERYDVPNARLRWVNPRVGVPVHTFRALSFNHTTFTKEVFMDQLARAAGRDALTFRLAHLATHPRQAAVLRRAAREAGWGLPLPRGHALGLAVQQANSGTCVAQVAQVSLHRGRLRVERVVCAIDCGFALHRDTVRAQVEGGIADGLGFALHGRLTLDEGRVVQSNFHDYPLLRAPEMPRRVDVHFIDSVDAPSGVGEPGSVLVAAAVANALVQLDGRSVRGLPLLTS